MQQQSEQKRGVLLTVSAFCWWGILVPVYFKTLTGIDALELVSHRIIWSLVFLVILIFWFKKSQHIMPTLKQPRLVWGLAVSGLLISFNWLLSVWAITHNQILAASFGYFINPLISVLLGILFLGERLSNRQIFALILVCLAVFNQIWQFGEVPWIALGLATSFGIYGLIRKQLQVDPFVGLFIEVMIVLPLALGYLLMLLQDNTAVFLSRGWDMDLQLALAGIITTVPLVLFVKGSQLIKLSSVGFLQYLIPTLSFILAVFVYHEPMTSGKLISFALIWVALLLISWDALRLRSNRVE